MTHQTAVSRTSPRRAHLRLVGIVLCALIAIGSFGVVLTTSTAAQEIGGASGPTPDSAPQADTYKIVGWNDLGMHCMNESFANLAVLPPYNTLWAQVIDRKSVV